MSRKSIEEVKENVESKGYLFIREYIRDGTTTRMVVIKDEFGYFYDVRLANLVNTNQNIRYVDKSNPYTLKNIELWLKLNNFKISLCKGNVYESSKSKLNFHCNICDENFECQWTNIFFKKGCPYCAGKRIGIKNSLSYTQPYLALEWSPENKISPKDVTEFSNIKILWKCSICKKEWVASIEKRSHGSGCPRCSSSRGEKRISRFFDDNGVIYIPQAKFEKCKNILLLPFDFYISDYNTCCEFHGIQHYEILKSRFFGEEKELLELQKRDKIKINFCKRNGIRLIVIPYWDYNNIEKILSEELNI